MGKTTKEKESLLQESQTELLLKDYFNKMKTIVGEEYAMLTLSSEYDIMESLSKFTSKFENVESEDIAFILLRQSLLSNEDNYFNDVIKEKVDLGELQDILYLVKENLSFRKSLTKTLMNQSNKSDMELFSKLEDKRNVITELSTLSFFEINLKARKLEKPYLRVKTR